ncbi:MAG: nucleoside kinase [Porphyromonadaceae bacterium]|nr:nucleoside kinase [Porphyromonadaceae bacterium]
MSKTVKIICKNLNNREFEFPKGTTLKEIYDSLNINLPYKVMLAYVNRKAESLDFQVFRPKIIEFHDVGSPAGYRSYVRTLILVLAKAIRELYPDDSLRVEHPISHGYYCNINGRDDKIPADKIAIIKERVRQIIKADIPIHSHEVPRAEAIKIFEHQGDMDTVYLIDRLGKPFITYYSLEHYSDYYLSVLAPSTGYLDMFDLVDYGNGMLLRVPDRNKPDHIAEFEPQPKLFKIFDEFARWNTLLGIENTGDFNRVSNSEILTDLIKVAEALHEKKIAQIADKVVDNDKKIVLISGPSSSGKTTFSKRLTIQLMTSGIKPITLSMDNYFVNREDTPLDEYGKYDFESLYALDLELFKKQLNQLLNGETVEIPIFDFETGTRQYRGDYLKLNGKSILIIEGIHALNPEITKGVDPTKLYKVYVSALTTISLDNHNWISTTDNRLLRRIIRDAKFRSYSAQHTISMWQSVRRGEDKWIFPFQEEADVMFNSSLIFEFDVLAKHAVPVLETVPQDSDEYAEAHRLLRFLQYFKPINEVGIPFTSLLREFLGGSNFKY